MQDAGCNVPPNPYFSGCTKKLYLFYTVPAASLAFNSPDDEYNYFCNCINRLGILINIPLTQTAFCA
jgi:hypothetical protein